MPQGGRLTITTTNEQLDQNFCAREVELAPGAYVMLAVSDTGCGIDPMTRAHVFEPFFTTKEPGKGTGLGLSTVYGIVKQSGGHISVESERGHGAMFRIWLPRIDTDVARIESAATPAPANARGGETILLVEDEYDVRVFVETVLSSHGYRVLPASNGEEALAVSRGHGASIDLLLTDVVMPYMGGYELARRLQEARPMTRVVYMSGYPGEALIRQGGLVPGSSFLWKPFGVRALVAKVRSLLDADYVRA